MSAGKLDIRVHGGCGLLDSRTHLLCGKLDSREQLNLRIHLPGKLDIMGNPMLYDAL